MPTLTVVATIIAKAGHAATAQAVFAPLIAASRQETGCLRYDFYLDNSNDHRFFMLEEWTDKAALTEHMRTAHFQALGQQLAGLIEVDIAEMTKLA